ncbi:MAG: OmpA family protein [Methylococcaceae bacterium]|nr:OmpA family protein [Methylococcaceae bacterium]
MLFIITLLIISRCSSDVSTEQDTLSNVAKNAVNNIDLAAEKDIELAKSNVGDVLGSTEKNVNNGRSTAESVASSAGKIVDNVEVALENAADSAKDTVGSPFDSTTDTGDAQSRKMTDSNLDLNSVNFKFNSSELESHFYTTLDSAVSKINKMNNPVEVAGHTDNIGSHGFNMALSLRRAVTVLNYLVSKGVDASRLSAKGYGAESPVKDNLTSQGRDANRRVELYKK